MPVRTCVGCRKKADKAELVRVVMTEAGPTADIKGILSGRGVYLCPNEVCLRSALKKNAVARGLKTRTTEEIKGFPEGIDADEGHRKD